MAKITMYETKAIIYNTMTEVIETRVFEGKKLEKEIKPTLEENEVLVTTTKETIKVDLPTSYIVDAYAKYKEDVLNAEPKKTKEKAEETK